MKKTIILIIIAWVFVLMLGAEDNQSDNARLRNIQNESQIITKTYILKNVTPSVVHETLRQYILTASYERNGNMFTVKITRENLPKFEELLRQIDVESKKVLIRIFVVVANQENRGMVIRNLELRKVLNELQNLLNFNSYRLDGVSAVNVLDGQRNCSLLLSSQIPLRLRLSDIIVQGGSHPGTRVVRFNFRLEQKLDNPIMVGKDTPVYYEELMESETSVKENGYLVAGVSKIGKSGDAIILIINTEIANIR